MKSNKNKYLVTLFAGLSVFVLDVASQDITISSDRMQQIESRVSSIPSFELPSQKASLLNEAQELKMEDATSTDVVRKTEIAVRLSEIFAEISIIEQVLIAVGSAGLLTTIFDDDSRDITPPVISINGSNPVTVERGTTYSDAGASSDGGESVSTNFGSLDTNVAGTYTITYSATDASGNTGYANRTVNVVDTIVPVVTVTGTNPATVELGDTYTDAGATSTEGTVTSSGTVDTSTVGTYTITYSATDASGNTGTATRTVNVTDTTAPVVTVTSGTDTVELGGTWTDAGATATDLSGTVTVVNTGTVDTETDGTYN
jgi:hypothetical protein